MSLVLKARWVFPATGDPIPEGSVHVLNRRIAKIGPAPAPGRVRDLGNVAILPGLINAHTHLEFSDLETPLGRQGIGLSDWIREVMGWRRTSTASRSPVPALLSGLKESVGYGVAAVGEIAQAPAAFVSNEGEIPHLTSLLEILGPTRARAEETLARAEKFLAGSFDLPGYRRGLSPHAPYTVRPELLEGAVLLAAAHRVPLAFHLAESAEEIQFLHEGTGPLRTLLEELGAWEPGLVAGASRPLDYLRRLANAPRALVVHGNYLGEEDWAFLGQQRDRLCTVFCPRTHAWFAHPRYSLEAMLASGVRVALGTDSRASSPDLDLMAEMRQVAALYPTVDPAIIFRMGTLEGAWALGVEDRYGSLEPGKHARLTMVSLPESDGDPYALLWSGGSPIPLHQGLL